METVIQALEKMGRATYREVAARLDIEPVEALNMLREQRDQGLCDFSDGGWFVGKLKDQQSRPAPAPAAAKAPLRGEEPKTISIEGITRLLAQRGTMDTVAIAREFGRNARGITAWMGSLARQGIVVKNGQGKGVTWSLPATTTETAEEPAAPAEIALPEVAEQVQPKDVAQIVSEIPSFTEGRDVSVTIPTGRVISREIRRAKSKLANLERLRDAVRVVGRHKHLVQQLINAEVENGKA